MAEILSKYFPGDVSMHSFDDKAASTDKKRAQWGLLVKVFKKRRLDVTKQDWEAVVVCEDGAAVALVDKLHAMLAGAGPGAAPPPRRQQQQQQQPHHHVMRPNGTVSPLKMSGGAPHHASYVVPGQVASPPTRVNARVSIASTTTSRNLGGSVAQAGSAGGLQYAVMDPAEEHSHQLRYQPSGFSQPSYPPQQQAHGAAAGGGAGEGKFDWEAYQREHMQPPQHDESPDSRGSTPGYQPLPAKPANAFVFGSGGGGVPSFGGGKGVATVKAVSAPYSPQKAIHSAAPAVATARRQPTPDSYSYGGVTSYAADGGGMYDSDIYGDGGYDDGKPSFYEAAVGNGGPESLLEWDLPPDNDDFYDGLSGGGGRGVSQAAHQSAPGLGRGNAAVGARGSVAKKKAAVPVKSALKRSNVGGGGNDGYGGGYRNDPYSRGRGDQMSAEVPGTDLRFFRNGADYEPYKQEDYQRVMGADGEYWKLGKLGPDLDSEELLRAKEKKQAIKEMDRVVRETNRRAAAAAAAAGGGLSKIDANKPKPAPSARERALAFAKQVPKPEVKRSGSVASKSSGSGGLGSRGGQRRMNAAQDEYFYGGGAQMSELEKLEMEHRMHQQKLAALAINR